MSRLKTLEDKVRAVLERDPKARDDDRILTLDVWCNLYGINPWSPVSEVLRNKDLPSQESLGRVRRKIQETDVSLRGTKAKEDVRMKAQADYIEYSKTDSTESRI
jgi:hypothetical protein